MNGPEIMHEERLDTHSYTHVRSLSTSDGQSSHVSVLTIDITSLGESKDYRTFIRPE